MTQWDICTSVTGECGPAAETLASSLFRLDTNNVRCLQCVCVSSGCCWPASLSYYTVFHSEQQWYRHAGEDRPAKQVLQHG